MEWMIMPLKRYADFKGRSRRKEYWMWTLGLLLVYFAFLIVIFAVVGSAAMSGGAGATGDDGAALFALFAGAGIVGIVFGLFILAVIIPALAVSVRRLHDINRSGWWVLAPTGLNLLGLALAGTGIDLVLSLLGFVASIALIVFFCLPGTQGPNRFGPDPKNPEGNLGEVFS